MEEVCGIPFPHFKTLTLLDFRLIDSQIESKSDFVLFAHLVDSCQHFILYLQIGSVCRFTQNHFGFNFIIFKKEKKEKNIIPTHQIH